jgi:hypothetical protein
MLFFAALLLVTPMPPPPPADSLAAATALWAEHPPTDSEKNLALMTALGEEAEQALALAGAGRGSGRGPDEAYRYANASSQLEARLLARVPQDRTALDREIQACAAKQVARNLTPAEIAQVREFMATDVGRRFWQSSALSLWSLRPCYRSVLNPIVTDEDYRAAGVPPPGQ